ncbi:MAG: hypothetical protein ACXWFY_01280 [Chthoniobacterales bacterium]
MKTKISAAVLILIGCVMMVFAAKVDPCEEKHKSCSDTCMNEQYHCKMRGSEPSNCERAYKMCMNKCDKDKQECESKSGGKSASPTATPKKKS